MSELAAENAELKRRLAQISRNSSNPLSPDRSEQTPPPQSSRRRTGRKPGKQPGARGLSLKVVDAPDEVFDYIPERCRSCGASLHDDHARGLQRTEARSPGSLLPSGITVHLEIDESRVRDVALRPGEVARTTRTHRIHLGPIAQIRCVSDSRSGIYRPTWQQATRHHDVDSMCVGCTSKGGIHAQYRDRDGPTEPG